MKLYNTLSGKKELLPAVSLSNLPKPKGKPLRPIRRAQDLRLFVCGPTVYDEPHIGHARTYLVFDSLVKYLRSQGVKVKYLQNITDIDDKIIARANKLKTTPENVARKHTAIYKRNMKALGITAVDTYAPATKFIPQIIHQVKTLLKKGYAYEIPKEGIYFDIKKFKDYGRLSRRTVLQAEDATTRIDKNIKKRNKGDFCLWKFGKLSEPSWPSSLGRGRPGWHIEDTAISEAKLGLRYELHGGGVDLKFPHHEAEIAQARALSGKKKFVDIWMHTGQLLVGGKKMSKSLRNYISIEDFLKRNPADLLRFLALSHHYRSPIHYTEALAKKSNAALEGLKVFLGKLLFIEKHSRAKGARTATLKHFQNGFLNALANDFNTSRALACIFTLMGSMQLRLFRLTKQEAKNTRNAILQSLAHLGFTLTLPKIPRNIRLVAAEREKFRANQQFVQSDTLRKKINGLGYIVEDTLLGQFLWPKNLN